MPLKFNKLEEARKKIRNNDYFINKNGEVFSQKRFGAKGGKVKQWKDGPGYWNVRLTINKIPKNYKVHRLLAEAFMPNPKKLPQINHKDGVKENNSLKNLEWCTARENLRHAYEKGLKLAKASTGEKYIYRDKVNNKWRLIISNPDGSKSRPGRYETMIEAKKARDLILKNHA